MCRPLRTAVLVTPSIPGLNSRSISTFNAYSPNAQVFSQSLLLLLLLLLRLFVFSYYLTFLVTSHQVYQPRIMIAATLPDPEPTARQYREVV